MKKTSSAKNGVPMTREEKRRIRRRKLFFRRMTVIVIAVLLLAAIVWGVIEIAKASRGETASFLGVKAIEVECVDGEGTVRYAEADIIRESGIYIGQSLLALNKVQASERVLARFPYLDYVEVKNSSFSTVCIRVAEAQVLAAVQTADAWLIVGDNNHVLEQVTTENLPAGVIRVTGTKALSSELGRDALEVRDLRICQTLVSAIAANAQPDMTAIDLTEKTNLRLWWKDRLEIVLGNESNLAAQVTAFKNLLPTLLDKNGDSVAGRLNMASYADDNTDNDRAVFTPADAIRQPTVSTESTTAASDAGGTGTATSDSTADAPVSTTGGTTAGTTVASAA